MLLLVLYLIHQGNVLVEESKKNKKTQKTWDGYWEELTVVNCNASLPNIEAACNVWIYLFMLVLFVCIISTGM